MILISSCLLGINCKYNGENNKNEKAKEIFQKYDTIPVCPEQLGGLSTPRTPAEIVDERIITKEGNDVTEEFQKGAREALKLAKLKDCRLAILQARSPSCGVNSVYDGTFSKQLKPGKGIFAKLCEKKDIKTISSADLEKISINKILEELEK